MIPVRGEVELIERLRRHGPFEDWWARPLTDAPLPAYVMVRRAGRGREDDEQLAHRLLRVARTMDRIAHPQFILQSVGTLRTPDGETLLLIEDPDGATCLQLADLAGTLGPEIAVYLVRQVVSGLAHAHALGEVHGGLDPSAVWLRRDGGARLDFGLGSVGAAPGDPTLPLDARFSEPSWLLETPRHPRLDVYGAAALLVWLLTGKPVRRGFGAPPRLAREDLSRGLRRAVRLGLGLEGAASPTAGQLSDALDRVFYADLDADDTASGVGLSEAVVGRIGARASLPTAPSGLEGSSVSGDFTLALAARESPLAPADMTLGDLGVSALELEALSPGPPTAPTDLPSGASPAAVDLLGAPTVTSSASEAGRALEVSPGPLEVSLGSPERARPTVPLAPPPSASEASPEPPPPAARASGAAAATPGPVAGGVQRAPRQLVDRIGWGLAFVAGFISMLLALVSLR